MVDDCGFEIRHADETPAGSRHRVNERCFSRGGGVVFSVKRFDEGLETLGAFTSEDEASCEKGMAGAVPGNYGFTSEGAGPRGFGRVGAVGRYLFSVAIDSSPRYCVSTSALCGIRMGSLRVFERKALNRLRRFRDFGCDWKGGCPDFS
jgi:hypothetical protein